MTTRHEDWIMLGMKTCEIPPFGVRIPPELKQQLKLSAKQNSRSLNAEIVFLLSQAVAQAPPSESLDDRQLSEPNGALSNEEMVAKMKALLSCFEKTISIRSSEVAGRS